MVNHRLFNISWFCRLQGSTSCFLYQGVSFFGGEQQWPGWYLLTLYLILPFKCFIPCTKMSGCLIIWFRITHHRDINFLFEIFQIKYYVIVTILENFNQLQPVLIYSTNPTDLMTLIVFSVGTCTFHWI